MTPPNDINQANTFQEKVCVIADEVLSILKELHQEQRKQIDSKLIAEKMFDKESVKKMLDDHGPDGIVIEDKIDPLKETVDNVLNRFSELLPSSMMEDLSDLKDQHYDKTAPEGSMEWMDSAVRIVKRYIDSVSNRVNVLEDLLQKTTHYLTDTEEQLATELSSVQGRFQEDRDFEDRISSNMGEMKQSFNISGDIGRIKDVVFSKIDNINKKMAKKKEQDILRLNETERTLQEMSGKMRDIKNEAEAMRKRSQEAEIESLQDNLTGLYNRKAYDLKVEETLVNLERYNVAASMLVCDIDYFKRINDNFGHHIGDRTLKKLAEIFKGRVRKHDMIARYGGEEFVCILSHTSLEEAGKVGEDLRSFIDRSNFSFKGKEVPVTISIGASSFRKGDDRTNVFERADAALYLAKRSGRNTVKTEDDVIEV